MKKTKMIFGLLILAALAGFLSCKRDMALKNPEISPAGTALVKIIDVSPNLTSVLGLPAGTLADTFNVLFNGVKITGYTPGTAAAVSYNNTYPFSGTYNGYASVPAGDVEIKFTKGLNTLDSVVLCTFHKTLTAGQYYSLIITDSIKSARDSSKMFIQDAFAPLTAGFIGLRFVNAAWNDTSSVDIWSCRNNKPIFTKVTPGTITAFNILGRPYLNDTFYVRRWATTKGLDTLVSVSFSDARSYTLVYKGNALLGDTSKSVLRRHLINYLNQ